MFKYVILACIAFKRSLSPDDDGGQSRKRRFDEGGSRQEIRLLVQSHVSCCPSMKLYKDDLS